MGLGPASRVGARLGCTQLWGVVVRWNIPVMGGFLYWALLRCSSTSLGVTQMTCCPFQYFTMLSDCSVLMMSFCVMLVIWLTRGRGVRG